MPDEPMPDNMGDVLFFSKGSAVILRILSGEDWVAWEVEDAQAVITWLQAWLASRESWQLG
jgi:hypothetical protein